MPLCSVSSFPSCCVFEWQEFLSCAEKVLLEHDQGEKAKNENQIKMLCDKFLMDGLSKDYLGFFFVCLFHDSLPGRSVCGLTPSKSCFGLVLPYSNQIVNHVLEAFFELVKFFFHPIFGVAFFSIPFLESPSFHNHRSG